MTDSSPAKDLRNLIYTFIRRFGLLDQTRTPCGLPLELSEAHALMELLQQGGIDQVTLASRLGMSKSAVTRMVNRLSRRDLILRERNRDDGRAYCLRLTPAGKLMAKTVDRASLAQMESILAELDESIREKLFRCFPTLVHAIPAVRPVLSQKPLKTITENDNTDPCDR